MLPIPSKQRSFSAPIAELCRIHTEADHPLFRKPHSLRYTLFSEPSFQPSKAVKSARTRQRSGNSSSSPIAVISKKFLRPCPGFLLVITARGDHLGAARSVHQIRGDSFDWYVNEISRVTVQLAERITDRQRQIQHHCADTVKCYRRDKRPVGVQSESTRSAACTSRTGLVLGSARASSSAIALVAERNCFQAILSPRFGISR
jgi:hypothetical protein